MRILRDKFMKYISALFLTLLLTCGPVLTAQSQTLNISAIVNEDIITAYDLNNRVRFLILSTGTKPSPESLKRLQSQALSDLVEEKLKLQAAKENNIDVANAVIEKEIGNLAQRNKLTADQFKDLFAKNNTDVQTLKDKLEADIGWARFVGRVLRRKVRISEDQVDDELAVIASPKNQVQRRVFEIFLPMENVEQEISTRANIRDIRAQALNGANFSTLARNYSKSTSASLGGDRGWLSAGQLSDDLDEAVQQLNTGEISEPVETLTGMFLFKVTDMRQLQGDINETKLNLLQLVVSSNVAPDLAGATLNKASSKITSCKQAEELASADQNLTALKLENIKFGDLSSKLKENLSDKMVGDKTGVINSNQQIMQIFVCDRQAPESNLPTRRDIRKQLLEAKLDILARQHLRDLKNAAFIDIRQSF